MPEKPLDHAREHYRQARQELAEREWVLTNQLVIETKKGADAAAGTLADMRALVREIPEQASLDFNSTRRDVIRSIEGMERELKRLREKLAQMGAWEP